MRRFARTAIITAVTLLPLTALAVATTTPTPSSSPSTAVSPAGVGPSTAPTPPALTSLTKAAQTARLATLKSRGDTEIQRRLTNLQSAQAKIAADTKLTGTDQATLTGQLTTEVSGLTKLKTTLDAETTLATARTDIQSIFADYRVYALMLPKARLVATADTESTALADLQTYEGLLAAKVSATDPSLVDMQAKLQAVTTLLNGFVTGVINLQPTDYNSDHTILDGKRDTLVQARSDLGAAQTDGQTISQSIK